MQPTYLHGGRLGWREAPDAVRDWVAERSGTVSEFEDRVGGMSTGLATVVTGERRRVFVKALDAGVNPDGERFYRREAEFAALLPDLPSVPRLLDHGTVDVGDHRWVVLLYPAAAGDPPRHPWRAADLTRVLDAWLPVREALTDIPGWPHHELIAPLFTGWRTIAGNPEDPWHAHAADWVEREERFVAAATETGPLIGAHVDLRADNLLIGPDGVWFVDWSHPDLAAPWLDPLIMLCDVVASGGDHGDGGDIDVARVWAEHPACAGDPEILIDGVSAFAAFMHAGSLKPPHPALPHGRAWQRLVSERTLPYALRHR